MGNWFVLIAGRSSRQGVSLNKSKLEGEYVAEISTIRISPEDAERLGIKSGDRVRLRNSNGEVVVRCEVARPDELSPGVLFMAYGEHSSRLMGGDTQGTGMPDSKGIDVELIPLGGPEPDGGAE